MDSQVKWLVERRVLLLSADAELTPESFQVAMKQAVDMAASSTCLTHMIIDGTEVNYISAYMVQMMKEAISLNTVSGFRWTVVIPESAHMILFSTMISTIMHRPVQLASDIQNAYAFLARIDPTLPGTYPVTA